MALRRATSFLQTTTKPTAVQFLFNNPTILTHHVLENSPGARWLARQAIPPSNPLSSNQQKRGYANEVEKIRRDLLKLLDTQIDENESDQSTSEIDSFLKTTGFSVTEEDGRTTLSKDFDNKKVTASFDLFQENEETPDQETNQDQDQEGEEGEQPEPQIEEETGDEDPQTNEKAFEVTVEIKALNKGGETETLQAQCAIGKDFRFYIESLNFENQNRAVFMEDLNEDLQVRLYDYFEKLGFSDGLGPFVDALATNAKKKSYVEILRRMQTFFGKQ